MNQRLTHIERFNVNPRLLLRDDLRRKFPRRRSVVPVVLIGVVTFGLWYGLFMAVRPLLDAVPMDR